MEGSCEYIEYIADSRQGGPPAWGLGEVLTIPHHKNLKLVTNHIQRPPNRTDPSVAANVEGFCERGNEPLGSIKCGEFIEQLRSC